jgi:hypothetical protein
MTSDFEKYVGRKFQFDDGAEITIVQVKRRDDGFWVTFEAQFNRALPRRSSMPEHEFAEHYAHLFV